MKKVVLKYCIDAKNQFTELEHPCNCYRNTLHLTYNFELYEVTFCSHWKNYKIGEINKYYRDRCYNNNTYTEEFIQDIMNILGFKYYDFFNYGEHFTNLSCEPQPATLKAIRLGDIDFIEPIYFHKGIPRYINRISINDFYNYIINKYNRDVYNIYISFNLLNPYPLGINNKLKLLYEEELDLYYNKLKAINKHIAKKNKCTVNETLLNIFKLIIKNRKNETSKQ